MINQVIKASSKGLKATYIGRDIEVKKVECTYQLVYMSPVSMICHIDLERNRIYQQNLICLTVDEAHLVENGRLILVKMLLLIM